MLIFSEEYRIIKITYTKDDFTSYVVYRRPRLFNLIPVYFWKEVSKYGLESSAKTFVKDRLRLQEHLRVKNKIKSKEVVGKYK